MAVVLEHTDRSFIALCQDTHGSADRIFKVFKTSSHFNLESQVVSITQIEDSAQAQNQLINGMLCLFTLRRILESSELNSDILTSGITRSFTHALIKLIVLLLISLKQLHLLNIWESYVHSLHPPSHSWTTQRSHNAHYLKSSSRLSTMYNSLQEAC